MVDDSSSRSYTGAASLLVLAVAFTGLFLGVENWWVAFVVGYGAVVPLVAMLTGEDEASEAHESEVADAMGTRERDREPASKEDAMETLRDRYARGELTEAQFERKLERLLETETLEDARETVDRTRRDRRDTTRTTEGSREDGVGRERDVEYE